MEMKHKMAMKNLPQKIFVFNSQISSEISGNISCYEDITYFRNTVKKCLFVCQERLTCNEWVKNDEKKMKEGS